MTVPPPGTFWEGRLPPLGTRGAVGGTVMLAAGGRLGTLGTWGTLGGTLLLGAATYPLCQLQGCCVNLMIAYCERPSLPPPIPICMHGHKIMPFNGTSNKVHGANTHHAAFQRLDQSPAQEWLSIS